MRAEHLVAGGELAKTALEHIDVEPSGEPQE